MWITVFEITFVSSGWRLLRRSGGDVVQGGRVASLIFCPLRGEMNPW